MKVNNISSTFPQPVFKGKQVVIKGEENTHVQYLFNIVKDAISHQPYKTGGVFELGGKGKITLNSASDGLIEYLKGFGIKFVEDVKDAQKVIQKQG